MSTSLIGGVVGAVIGSFVPGVGTAWGWAIGSALGAIYDYSQLPDNVGPRLEDLSITANTFGEPIPRVWGTARLPGTMIWKTRIIEHENSESAKGGPETVTFTYTFSGAYVICEGPVEGVTRIWANKRLIYDITPGSEVVRDFTSISALRVYTGTETQTIDPLIIAMAGSSPAYRGYVYVVFEDFLLTEHYGNHPPSFEFEVIERGDPTAYTVTMINDNPDVAGGYTSLMYNPAADELWAYKYVLGTDLEDVHVILRIDPNTGEVLSEVDAGPYMEPGDWLDMFYSGLLYDPTRNFVWSSTSRDDSGFHTDTHHNYIFALDAQTGLLKRQFQPIPDPGRWAGFTVNVNTGTIVLRTFNGPMFAVMDGETGAIIAEYTTSPSLTSYEMIFDRNGRLWFYSAFDGNLTSLQIDPDPDGGSPDPNPIGTIKSYPIDMTLPGFFLHYNIDSNSIWLTGANTSSGPGETIEFDLDTMTQTDIHLFHGGNALSWRSGRIAYDDFHQTIFFAESGSFAGDGGYYIYGYSTLDGSLRYQIPVHYNLSGAVWDPVRVAIFFTGEYPYQPGELGSEITELYRIDFERLRRQGVSLDEVVTDICVASDLTESDIDVSDLISDIVTGYVRPRQMSGRDQLEPLMSAYYFDPVESDDKIKFVKRGSTSVVTIPAADRAAHEVGGDPPASLNLTRSADLELPWEMEIRFIDIDHDLQPGTAYARRLSHFATAAVKIDMPIVMEQAKADEVAQTILYAAWRRRVGADWTTTRKYDVYEPTDLVTLPTDSENYDIRITQKRNLGNGVIEWSGVEENQDDFPAAVGDIVIAEGEGIASGDAVGEPSLLDPEAGGTISALLIDNALQFEPDSGVYYNWFYDYGVRAYVPERDEWWLNGNTDDPGFDDDGTWYLGQEVLRFPATSGVSPDGVQFTAIPLISSPVLVRYENSPYPLLYDPVNSVVWGAVWAPSGPSYVRSFIHKIDAATGVVIAFYPSGAPVGEKVFGMRINPYNGDLWLNYSGSQTTLRLFSEGSPTVVRSITVPWTVYDTAAEVQFEDEQFAWVRRSSYNEVARVDLVNNTYQVYDLTGIGGIGYVPPSVDWPPGQTLGISSIMWDPDRHSLWVVSRFGDQFFELGGFLTEVVVGSPMSVGTEVSVYPQGTWNVPTYDPVNQRIWFGRYLHDPNPPYEDIVYNHIYVVDPATGEYSSLDLSPLHLYYPQGVTIGVAEDDSARIVTYLWNDGITDENDDNWGQPGLYQLTIDGI